MASRVVCIMLALLAWVGWSAIAIAAQPAGASSGTPVVMPEGLPFSEAVRVGDVLYLSGQIGIRPGTMELVEGGLEAQARQTMKNIRATLAAHGYTLGDLVKCTIMLADISKWEEFNKLYTSFFAGRYPARSAFGTAGLALGAEVEIDCIAAKRARGQESE